MVQESASIPYIEQAKIAQKKLKPMVFVKKYNLHTYNRKTQKPDKSTNVHTNIH